jgi:hypothetical protein
MSIAVFFPGYLFLLCNAGAELICVSMRISTDPAPKRVAGPLCVLLAYPDLLPL